MPLSEHEQRLLDQIERALIAEDPKFASAVRAGRLGKPTRRRRIQGLVVFLIGLVLLVVGVAVHSIWLANVPVVSVVGFLVMLTGALMAITSLGAGGKAPPRVAEPERNRFGGKMEERFRRRFDQE
jgi:VIT1/CCC1 family predicted Fe2+/Mn2+ transporter